MKTETYLKAMIGVFIGGIILAAVVFFAKNPEILFEKHITSITLVNGEEYSGEEVRSIEDVSSRVNPDKFLIELSDGSRIEVERSHVKELIYEDGSKLEIK